MHILLAMNRTGAPCCSLQLMAHCILLSCSLLLRNIYPCIASNLTLSDSSSFPLISVVLEYRLVIWHIPRYLNTWGYSCWFMFICVGLLHPPIAHFALLSYFQQLLSLLVHYSQVYFLLSSRYLLIFIQHTLRTYSRGKLEGHTQSTWLAKLSIVLL
jgi:hypothetical protein